MALSIPRDAEKNIRNSVYYSFMANETTYISNREQFVVDIRHLIDDLVAHQEYIESYKIDYIGSKTLTSTIEEYLLQMNLYINNCCGQRYDGASNLSGVKKRCLEANLWQRTDICVHAFTITFSSKDLDIIARVIGVDAQMKSFGFLFGGMLGKSILNHTDNLSKGLQQQDFSASEGPAMAQLTLETIIKLRSDDGFNDF